MIYQSRANWILYRIDEHNMKHIVREYDSKPTTKIFEQYFLYYPLTSYFDEFKRNYENAFNSLVDGVESIINNKKFILEKNH